MNIPPTEQLCRFVNKVFTLAEGKQQTNLALELARETQQLITYAETLTRRIKGFEKFLEERSGGLEGRDKDPFAKGERAACEVMLRHLRTQPKGEEK
jgi:hypothetical protein